MNDMTDTGQDPATIEREIRRTQDDMSRTVDRIGGQLTPRNIFNALLDQAEDNDIDARMLLDGARRNPLALAMIAGGAIWLASDHDAKLPRREKHAHGGGGDGDHYHRDYLAHMDRVEWRDGEDDASYQRRRDMARASYLMVERGHDEDDAGFRKRLDEAAERFRDKRHAWSDQASQMGNVARAKGAETAGRARDLFQENPLIGGLLAAAFGAIAGTAVPMTRMEDEKLSDVGSRARGLVGEQAGRLTDDAREKKDALVEKAGEKLDNTGRSDQGIGQPMGSGAAAQPF